MGPADPWENLEDQIRNEVYQEGRGTYRTDWSPEDGAMGLERVRGWVQGGAGIKTRLLELLGIGHGGNGLVRAIDESEVGVGFEGETEGPLDNEE